MPKQTLEAALLARREDPRALRGALTFIGGKPRLVFGVVGDHRRFSVDVAGDKLTLADDPRIKIEAEDASEASKPPVSENASEEPEKPGRGKK